MRTGTRLWLGLLGVLVLSPLIGCDSDDSDGSADAAMGGDGDAAGAGDGDTTGDGDGDTTGGGDGDTTGDGDGDGDGDAVGDGDGDGDGAGVLSVTGTLGGEAFTIDCVDVLGQIYSNNGQYNFQCGMDTPNASITGPIYLFDFNTTAVDVGTRHVGGSDPRAYTLSRFPDYASFGPDSDDDTADLTIEVADDNRLKGSLSGSWTQPDYSNNMVEITIEMQGTFDIPMDVL